MRRVEISLLGPVRVRMGDAEVQLRTDSAAALLTYLVLHAGTPCRREVLAGLLWPDAVESEALHNLRQVLYHLRRTLDTRESDSAPLRTTRKSVRLNLGETCWADVAAFEAAVAAATAGATNVSSSSSRLWIGRRAARLAEAVELYRGDLLSGFSFPSAPFEEWLVVERERLRLRALEAIGQLAVYHERRGEWEPALRYARRQLELEPWLEEAHRRAMRLLAGSGQRDAALEQYEACRQVLAQELGIEPQAETIALRDRIREGHEEARFLSAPPHNLPASLTPFAGREAELALIAERLADPACRLLTLVGPGGIGKTRLALQAASEHVGSFADGVFFVPLGSVSSPEGILPAVGQALGLRSASPVLSGDSWRGWSRYLRTRSVLLVLDGLEHLLACHEGEGMDGAQQVVEILHAAPGVKILVASRAELNVLGETLLPVEGMGCPPLSDSLSSPEPGSEEEAGRGEGSLAGYSAVELFLSAVCRARPRYEPTPQEVRQVAHICRQVQGMPLAILLAASWIKVLPLGEIVRRLGGQGAEGKGGPDLDFLAADWRNVPPGQRSMRAVLDRSWSLLSEKQQTVLAVLATFRSPFTERAALEVAGASSRMLQALVGRSVLGRAAGGRTGEVRFELHDLVRQYAAEKLASWLDGGASARDRHCAYYAAAMRDWADDLVGPRELTALVQMQADLGNCTVAWEWGLAHGQVERLRPAFSALWRFFKWGGRYREGYPLLKHTAEALRSWPGSQARALRSYVLAMQGHFEAALGHGELRRPHAQEALSLLEGPDMAGLDVRQEKAHALYELAACSQGEEAARLYVNCALLAREAGDQVQLFLAQYSLGWLTLDEERYEEAVQWFRESVATIGETGFPLVTPLPLTALARIERLRGRHAQAEEWLRQAVAEWQQFNDWPNIAGALHTFAFVRVTQGEYAAAASLVEQSMAIHQELGYHEDLARPLATHGLCVLHLGEYEQARMRFEASLGVARECNHQRDVAWALSCMGAEALGRGMFGEAREALQQGLALYREEGEPADDLRVDLGWTLACLGIAEHGLGRTEPAVRHLEEALLLAARTREDPMTLAAALGGMALVCADRGEIERAAELYAQGAQAAGPSRWWREAIGQHLEAAMATLPPEVVEVAQERGRARELQSTIQALLVGLGQRVYS